MKRRQGYVFRLTPNAAQDSLLRQFVGCSRLVWNAVLSENEFRYAAGDPLPIGRKSFCSRLLDLKVRYTFLTDAYSQPLQQTLNDLVKAYERAFDPKLAAQMPKFKKKQHAQGIRFPQGFRIENKRVQLPKIGWLNFRCSARTMKRKLEGKITSVTVKLNAGLWYVAFATEREVELPIHPLMGEVVGIDLGVSRWAALSDEPGTPGGFAAATRALREVLQELGEDKAQDHQPALENRQHQTGSDTQGFQCDQQKPRGRN